MMNAAGKPQRTPVNAFARFRTATVLAALLALVLLHARAQSAHETVGRIEGDDISLRGAVGVDVTGGRSATVLASGSEIFVRSGQARVTLEDGSELGICGPAHLSLLKSGEAITAALDQGRLRARLSGATAFTFYTPLIVATPVAIGEGPRDSTVSIEPTGAMCLRAGRGAVRLEHQLTGQSLLVPQNGEITLVGGQLDSARGSAESCTCEILAARATPPAAAPAMELSTLARPKPPEKIEPKEPPSPPVLDEPIYTVLMPPLRFDATHPVPPPDPSPDTMILVRQARVRPSVVFRGRVESPPQPVPAAPTVRVAANKRAEEAPPKKEASVVARIWNFFRRFSMRGGPCAGVGCGGTAR